MDNLETPYDAEVVFIECKVCNKSVRGETLYKIHLTTPAHMKGIQEFKKGKKTIWGLASRCIHDHKQAPRRLKEESLNSQGATAGQRSVPNFQDILEYLDYLKLDEPIIGLDCLEELPSDESLSGPNYSCNLCSIITNMSEMVHHVIGRKHRQRYLEVKRKDLVTWDNLPFPTKGAKIIRAKAEIIERQDGRGFPKVPGKKGVVGKSNTSTAQASVPPNREKRFPKRPNTVPPLLPEFTNYHNKHSLRRYPGGFHSPPRFYSKEGNIERGGQHDSNHQFGFNHMEGGHHRGEYTGDQDFGDDTQSYHSGPSDEQFAEYPDRGEPFRFDFPPKPDYREKMPNDQDYAPQSYQNKNPFQGPFPERDAPGECFNQGERPHVYPLERKPPPMFPKGENWSGNMDPSGYGAVDRPGRQDLSEPEAKRRFMSSPVEGGNRISPIVKDYHHQAQGPHHGEAREKMKGNPNISNLPEIFKQFLSGAPSHDPVKRKRKSRFSDASPEEIRVTHQMISEPMLGKFDIDRRRGDEADGLPYSGQHRESQNFDYAGSQSQQRQAAESEDVFDMLQNVEIKTAEEAEFLKAKLCSLLREFKSRENQKGQEQQQFREPYERLMRKNSNLGHQDALFEDTHPRAFNQWGQHTPEGPQQEFPHSSHNEPRHPSRRLLEDDHRRPLNKFGHLPEGMQQEFHHSSRSELGRKSRSSFEAMERVQNSSLDKPPYRTERFQEPFRSQIFKPPEEELYDPFTMEEEHSTQRDACYSSSLKKITSTLLELVSRK